MVTQIVEVGEVQGKDNLISLKPCPFCGGEATIVKPAKEIWHRNEKGMYYVTRDGESGCWITQCKNSKCIGHHYRRFKTMDESVAAWNGRSKEYEQMQ